MNFAQDQLGSLPHDASRLVRATAGRNMACPRRRGLLVVVLREAAASQARIVDKLKSADLGFPSGGPDGASRLGCA